MSTEISFDAPERRLNDKNVIKAKSTQIGSEESNYKDIPITKLTPGEVEGSTAENSIKQQSQLVNRKVDYYIEQESNELVVKIRDGETGEIIRQIPEEEFLRLTNRISSFNETILDETV